MTPKSAKRFLSRNAWKIARRNLDRKFGWMRQNSFDNQILLAKEELNIKRTIPESFLNLNNHHTGLFIRSPPGVSGLARHHEGNVI